MWEEEGLNTRLLTGRELEGLICGNGRSALSIIRVSVLNDKGKSLTSIENTALEQMLGERSFPSAWHTTQNHTHNEKP